MERRTVKLKSPVQVGSETITELSLRPMKAKDMRDFPMEGQTMGHLLDLAGKLAGHPRVVMDELAPDDLMAVAEVIAGFLPAGLGTGPTR